MTAQPLKADTWRFGRFVAVGLLNTGFGYVVYLLGLYARLTPAVALAIATLCGAFFNYLTTGQLVFRHKSAARLPRFLAAYGVTYCVNLALLKLAIAQHMPAWLAQAIVLPLVVVASYMLMSRWVFRGTQP